MKDKETKREKANRLIDLEYDLICLDPHVKEYIVPTKEDTIKALMNKFNKAELDDLIFSTEESILNKI